MTAGELCTRTVVVAYGDEGVLEAGRRMRDRHVGSLVVVEDTEAGMRPIGIVTDRDLLTAIVGTHASRVPGLRVAEVMTWDLLTARERDDANESLGRMRVRGVRRMPVLDEDGLLQGILAYDDLVEWLAEQLFALSKLVQNEQRRERGLRP